MSKRSGFVAIIGRPNVGKSTLLNHIIGEKLAGVSAKPQTTRGMVRGIVTRSSGQIVYLDTPGHHKPKDKLGNWMLGEIEKALESADLIYWLVLPHMPREEDLKILSLIKKTKTPVFLVINQIDRFSKEQILPVLAHYQEIHAFKEYIPISAKQGTQVAELVKLTLDHLPEGEYLYPEDQISDQQERYFLQEIIREKLYRHTGQEIPYSASVTIDSCKERRKGLTDIHATITVERKSQRTIVIGKKGEKLKLIGQEARKDIEGFLRTKVFLEIWVKVLADWKEKDNLLRRLGYE